MLKEKVIVVLLVLGLCELSGASLCLRAPRCYCNTKNVTTIYCKNVTDLAPIEAMSAKFGHIYSLRIYGLDQSAIDRRIFEGQSITVLDISGSLESISDDALTGIHGLKIVNFDGSCFPAVPEAFANPSFKIVQLVHGSLRTIDDQLQNNTYATDFLFNNNRIANVSPTALLNVVYLLYLNLSYNQLSHLDPAVFSSSVRLKSLDLAHNQLYTVDGCFQNLSPQALNLYDNNLVNVDNAFHPSMWNMKRLNLGGNPNLNLSSSTFNDSMKYLTELNLNDNHFSEIDTGLLKNFRYLYTLYLNGNNLTSVPQDFLINTRHLTTIELGDNNLASADELFPSENPEFAIHTLKIVKLDGNSIRSIKFGASAKSVLVLDLSRNLLTAIQSMDLENLTSVTSLNFSDNSLERLETGCFQKQSRLRSLDLTSRKLTTLNHAIQNLPSLDRLIIESSSLTVIDENELVGLNGLKILSLRNSQLVSIHRAMKGLINLTTLDVSHNNLTTLTLDSFAPGSQNKLKKLWMEGNPWSCDCRISWILDWLKTKGSILEDNPICQSPPYLQGKPIRSLNQTDLELWLEDCPPSCDCTCVPDGKDVYTTINCTSRGLTKTPPDFPKNAREIYLRDNGISHFDGFESEQFPLLRLLDLENNNLSSVQLKFLPSTIGLKLAGNNLSIFPIREWNATATKSVTLSKNPWICDCNAWDFRQWLVTYNNAVEDIQEIRCASEGKFSNKVIIHFVKEDLCSNFKDVNTIVVAVVASCFILICICCVIFRKTLAVICYSCGCSCLKPYDKYQYSFDAFLLYADEDEDFALNAIAEGLESRPQAFNLFIPTRHIFLTTTPVNIESSLNDCCKVIVLLTLAFIRNEQCMQLLKASISYSLTNSSRRLIFITKDRNLPMAELDPVLASIVKKSVCLRWGQFLFWERLRYCLPKKTPLLQNSSD